MRASEFENKPHLYLDMDGVQADFFTAWAQWHNRKFGQSHVERYKDIGSREQREQSITELNKEGPDFIAKFFATLPTLPGGQKLIRWLKTNRIPFTVLSAPLRNNEPASIAGKKYWLTQHNPGVAAEFTSEKQQYAKHHGQPAVLVDDFKKYVNAWQDAGGIGILYRDDNVDGVIQQLSKIYGVGQDVTEAKAQALRTYTAKVQLKQPGYKNIIDTTVQARNPEMARRLIRQQYGDRNVIVGQPRELK
jgi:5'(3')-deoxyribonucleotidase